MITLSRFFAGNPLYTDVFTQYGPAYYFLQWFALAPVSHDVTHDIIRVQTIVIAVALSLIAGLIAFRLTRSSVGAFAAQFTSVLALRSITNEPGHPQAICLLLLAAALLAVTCLTGEPGRRNTMLLVFAGFCLGLLIGVKINVGLYFGVATVMTLLIFAPTTGAARIAVPLVALGLAGAMIFAVLGKYIGLEWVLMLAASVFVAILLAVGAARFFLARSTFGTEPFPYVGYIAPTALGVTLGIAIPVCFVLLRGTMLSDLWYGMVGQHVGFAGRFMMSPGVMSPLVPVGIAFALVSAVVVFAIPFVRWKGLVAASPSFSFLLALLKIIAACLCARALFLQALPCLFLVLVPLHLNAIPDASSARKEYLPRLLLVLGAILEGLWIFPVAGSQIGMSSYLPHILAGVLLADGVIEAAGAFSRIARSPASVSVQGIVSPRSRIALSRVSAVVFLVCLLTYGVLLRREATVFAQSVPLGLHGSHLIRLAPARVKTLRTVTEYLRNNADTVLMLPGQYSFTFWANLNPPTGKNAGAWPILFDDKEQEALVAIYKERAYSGRLVGMLHEGELSRWVAPPRHASDATTKPLFRYVTEEMRPVTRIDGYLMLAPITEKNTAR